MSDREATWLGFLFVAGLALVVVGFGAWLVMSGAPWFLKVILTGVGICTIVTARVVLWP